jgi:hypothetical protein
MGAAPRRTDDSRTALATLPWVSLLGFLGLAVNAVLSFEEPERAMLLASGLLLLAAPLGLLVHLGVTRKLTRAEKRAWIAGLTGRRGMAFLAAYFEGNGRRTALEQVASESGGDHDASDDGNPRKPRPSRVGADGGR